MPDGPIEPLTPGVPTTVTCPGCGVDVAVGYPRCPRCHATVPQPARQRRQSFRDSNLLGGTSVEPPPGPGGRLGLVLIGLAGLAAILLVVWLATRDSDRRQAVEPAADVVEDEDDVDEVEDEADDTGSPDEEGEDLPAADDLPAAIRDLDEALRAAQMWSKITREGDVVVVESSLCDDGGMWSAIAPLAAQLRDAGASAVRCQEPHGGVAFEREL